MNLKIHPRCYWFPVAHIFMIFGPQGVLFPVSYCLSMFWLICRLSFLRNNAFSRTEGSKGTKLLLIFHINIMSILFIDVFPVFTSNFCTHGRPWKSVIFLTFSFSSNFSDEFSNNYTYNFLLWVIIAYMFAILDVKRFFLIIILCKCDKWMYYLFLFSFAQASLYVLISGKGLSHRNMDKLLLSIWNISILRFINNWII